MIKNDLLQFISSSSISKGLNSKTKKGLGEKQSSFEDILSAKNKASNYVSPYKKDNLKLTPTNDQASDVREPSTKDKSALEQKNNNKDISYSQSEANKKAEDKKLIASENKENESIASKEDTNIDSLYSYLASTLLGTESMDDNIVQMNSEFENSEQIVSSELILNLDFNEDRFEAAGTMLMEQEDIVFIEENQADNSFKLSLEAELKKGYRLKNQESVYLEEESSEVESKISKDLTSIINTEEQVIINKDQTDIQDTKLLTKAFLEEDKETIQKDNKGKIIENKNQILFDEEPNIQNNNINSTDMLAHFNDSNQSKLEQSIENTFETMLAKEKPVILDRESIFGQIVEKVKVDINKTDEIKIKLKPDFLGELSLKISNEKGIITVKAYVENYNVKQLIESNLDNLRDNMRELGLSFEALDVSVGKDSSFERDNSQAWKQEQKIRAIKPKIESLPIFPTYEEEIGSLAGGLYTINGNLDLIV